MTYHRFVPWYGSMHLMDDTDSVVAVALIGLDGVWSLWRYSEELTRGTMDEIENWVLTHGQVFTANFNGQMRLI
jgi:hypothetical protein